MQNDFQEKCYGDNHQSESCPYIDTCVLCIDITHCEDDCKTYMIGAGTLGLKCKRDNPEFKGFTKQQVFEMYKRLQKKEPVSITEILDFARIKGILIEN